MSGARRDDLALEWGVGKTFRPASWQPWVAQLDLGVAGYAQWQVTDNRGSDIPPALRGIKSNVHAVGPEITATTKFGRFFARYEFEFGSQNTSHGQVFLFGLALLFDLFKSDAQRAPAPSDGSTPNTRGRGSVEAEQQQGRQRHRRHPPMEPRSLALHPPLLPNVRSVRSGGHSLGERAEAPRLE